MSFNIPEFRDYLRKMIGNRTQSEFARERGITPEHLSRILRSEKPGRPSKATLKNLAGGSEKDRRELERLCGYADDEARIILETDEEKVMGRIREMRDGFSDMTKGARVFGNLREFLDEYLLLYDTKNAEFSLGPKMEYEGEGHFGAEYVAPIVAATGMGYQKCKVYAAVYFSETKGGKTIVLDTAFDGRSVAEAGVHMDDERRKEAEKLPYLYTLETDSFLAKQLLDSIFGGDKNRQVVVTKIGMGFRFVPENISDDVMKGFAERHRGSFGEKESELAERLAAGGPAESVFSGYSTRDDLGEGKGAFIAEIMRRVTGIGFTFYRDVRENAESAVMVEREDYGDYDMEDLISTAGRFAKELELESYGECFVCVHDYIDGELQFQTKGEEET